ncbi:MAG: carbohydrate ABC transporter substrate-binding protein, partial [Alphaproteobacteria bacterium]|nr:carbohydrate ABC transporter substrate-binding protein [Alphaproteobacteria bacterium]
MRIARRHLLASLAVGATAPAIAQAPAKLTIASHRIHQIVSTGAQGGDITRQWSERNRTAVEWVTFEVGPLRERLFREASLRDTSIDIGFLLNTQLTPATANLFEPLEGLLATDPVEDMPDLFQGMVE